LPQQDRSKVTVDAILTATARILTQEGYDRATTNRIAELAGVSIGSLYQYFPSKEALVTSLAEQHVNTNDGHRIKTIYSMRQSKLFLHELVSMYCGSCCRSNAA